MKSLWKEACYAAVMGLVVPGVLLGIVVRWIPQKQIAGITESTVEIHWVPVETKKRQIEVLNQDGVVSQMELEEYLVGVVLAEMPVSFEEEARKAQAVVARTFTLKSENGGKHENAAVCMDSACCQAYLSEAEYLEKGGTLEGIEKMRSAVEATAGEVLQYQGSLIEATYFSCSGGATEDAVAVWGTEVAYLQSVDSPGEEEATYYVDSVTFTPSEFASALGADLKGEPESWLGSVTFTRGGGVNTMVIGGKTYHGTELRKRLGLRSTAFTIAVGEDKLTITTRGYGHRVGMSQYGADAMAVAGSTYQEILAHYYQGTELIKSEN